MEQSIQGHCERRAVPRPGAAPWPRHDRRLPEAPRLVTRGLPEPAAERRRLRAGLLGPEARIDPKYFYDSRGCALFSAICGLPEYYLTRTEAAIFDRYRDDIARHLPAHGQWIDLGCGDGAKSVPWLAAAGARRFIGVDIARESLVGAIATMADRFARLDCLGVITDLSQPLALDDLIADHPGWPPVFFYPGSSLGNFTAAEGLALLQSIRRHLGNDGALLIGIDLIKEPALLEAAYDDAQGITAAFNRNVLRVANRLLDADFVPERFDHLARFNAAEGRMEMHLRARQAHGVRIDGSRRAFAAGETILTEYSHKYTPAGFAHLLERAGFGERHAWTDARGWFAVFVARP